MKKFTNILFMLFLLVFVAAGSIVPNEAMATNDEEMQLMPGNGEPCDDLIMEQNGDGFDGSSGDPDSLGDGFGFIGDSFGNDLSGLVEGGIITVEEYIRMLIAQMYMAQQ